MSEVQGPVAQSLWYIETSRNDVAYLRVDHSSREYTEGSDRAFYVAGIHDNARAMEYPRCVRVHTDYLAQKCRAIDTSEVPEKVKADLEDILGRQDESGVWDKKYVGG